MEHAARGADLSALRGCDLGRARAGDPAGWLRRIRPDPASRLRRLRGSALNPQGGTMPKDFDELLAKEHKFTVRGETFAFRDVKPEILTNFEVSTNGDDNTAVWQI